MTNEMPDYGWSEVGNAILIKKVFGYWPAFHDAYLLSIHTKQRRCGVAIIDITIELRHWGQDDPNWTVRGSDCVITLTFFDVKIVDIPMATFFEDNSIDEIHYARTDDDLLLFELDPNTGSGIFLACVSAEISRIEPYQPGVASTTT